MNRTTKERTHHQGHGRTYLGLGISTIGLFWLANKIGWVGVGSSGLVWPVFAIAIGGVLVLRSFMFPRTTNPCQHVTTDEVAK